VKSEALYFGSIQCLITRSTLGVLLEIGSMRRRVNLACLKHIGHTLKSRRNVPTEGALRRADVPQAPPTALVAWRTQVGPTTFQAPPAVQTSLSDVPLVPYVTRSLRIARPRFGKWGSRGG
jgi:hypothetical protein